MIRKFIKMFIKILNIFMMDTNNNDSNEKNQKKSMFQAIKSFLFCAELSLMNDIKMNRIKYYKSN